MAPIVGERPDDRWYVAPEFENTPAILRTHAYYRFGFNNDFGNMFNESPAWRQDYLYGTCAVSGLIATVFLAWCVTLVILKCMGSQAGCAAGLPPEGGGGGYESHAGNLSRVSKQQLSNKSSSPNSNSNNNNNNNNNAAPSQKEQQQQQHSPLQSFRLLRGGSFFRRSHNNNNNKKDDQSAYSRKSSDMSSITRGSSTKHLSDTEILLMRHIDGLDDARPSSSKAPPPRRTNTLDSHFFSFGQDDRHDYDHDNDDKCHNGDNGKAVRRTTIDSHFFSLPELPESVTEELSQHDEVDDVEMLLHSMNNSDLLKHRETYELTRRRQAKKFRRVRAVFLWAGVGVIVCDALLMDNLVSLFHDSFLPTRTAVGAMTRNLDAAMAVTDDYLVAQSKVSRALADFSQHVLHDWCPSSSSSAQPRQGRLPPLQEQVDDVTDTVRALGTLLEEEVMSINEDLYELRGGIHTHKTFAYVNWALDSSMAAAVSLVVIVCLLMSGTILAHTQRSTRPFSRLQTYFFLPLFALGVTALCAACCLFAASLLMAADFCLDSPRRNVVSVLDARYDDLSPVVRRLIRFYVEGCPTTTSTNTPTNTEAFARFDDRLEDAIYAIHDFITLLSRQDTTAFQATCGVLPHDALRRANELEPSYHEALTQLFRLQAVFTCSSFNQPYVDLFYEAICYNGTSGLETIFMLSLLVVFFSMIIITLRVSWHQINYETSNSNIPSEVKSILQKKSTYEFVEDSSHSKHGNSDVHNNEMKRIVN